MIFREEIEQTIEKLDTVQDYPAEPNPMFMSFLNFTIWTALAFCVIFIGKGFINYIPTEFFELMLYSLLMLGLVAMPLLLLRSLRRKR